MRQTAQQFLHANAEPQDPRRGTILTVSFKCLG